MASEQEIQKVMNSLDRINPCSNCGMRYCVGDLECPHCGSDRYDALHDWAEALLDSLSDPQ
ncbi:MAG: hypothetical protein CL744_03075 [Chloroflexi bacterium]|nr:hypothetical protein [Chloroflexota bacterium]